MRLTLSEFRKLTIHVKRYVPIDIANLKKSEKMKAILQDAFSDG